MGLSKFCTFMISSHNLCRQQAQTYKIIIIQIFAILDKAEAQYRKRKRLKLRGGLPHKAWIERNLIYIVHNKSVKMDTYIHFKCTYVHTHIYKGR